MKNIIIDYRGFDIDEEIMYRNSLVMNPAHESNAHFFNGQKIRFFADEEKRMIVGVAIEANIKIFRKANDVVNFDHTVEFIPETVEVIRNSFHKSDKSKLIRFDHEGVDINEMILVQSYIVGGKENPKLPEIFKDQNVNEGSWILGYFVENKKVWELIKQKGFRGFSVEVAPYLNIQNFKQQKQIKMKKQKFSWSGFFGKNNPKNFAEATTADGATVKYEGELAIGTILMIAGEGEDAEDTPYVDANDILTVDGVDMAVETDDTGAVVALAEVEEAPEATDAILAEFAIEVRKQLSERDAVIKRLEESFSALSEKFSNLERVTKAGKSNFRGQSGKPAKSALELLK